LNVGHVCQRVARASGARKEPLRRLQKLLSRVGERNESAAVDGSSC